MYAPSEQVEQVKKQMMKEFGDQIISFEWDYEVEFTGIYVHIRSTALQIPIGDRLYDIINTIIDDKYIVSAGVIPVESVNATDGLFNLTCTGGTNFFADYYPAGRARDKPYITPIHYLRMFKAVRTIHLDSAEQFWDRLIRPLDEKYAKHEGFNSFTKELLAEALRNFLLEHLDFIQHIAEAVRRPLQILDPQSQPAPLSSNGTGRLPLSLPQPQLASEVALPALAAA